MNLPATTSAFGYLLASAIGDAPTSVLERLDPPERAAVIMALLGLVLTGLLLVICIMLGGHWVRRLARNKPNGETSGEGVTGRRRNRRLRESLHPVLPPTSAGETLHVDSGTNDTKADS